MLKLAGFEIRHQYFPSLCGSVISVVGEGVASKCMTNGEVFFTDHTRSKIIDLLKKVLDGTASKLSNSIIKFCPYADSYISISEVHYPKSAPHLTNDQVPHRYMIQFHIGDTFRSHISNDELKKIIDYFIHMDQDYEE